MPFTLPESYASYVADPAISTAVDHILESESLEVPDVLEWNQLPDFHAAVLAAHQVSCEYASALQRLWDEVWGRAIDEAPIGQELEARSITDTAERNKLEFNARSLWENEVFVRTYTRGDFSIDLGIKLSRSYARLMFWFGDDGNENGADNFLPEDDWDLDEQTDYGCESRRDLARINAGGIPLERLNEAAARALAAIP